MSSEKKIFPKLYPLNRELNRIWFIKYQTEDFINGGFIAGKYQGACQNKKIRACLITDMLLYHYFSAVL